VLLAVGAVNLSGLLLARSLARDHEFAIQRALGASRARLMRQSLIDGVLLSCAGFAIAMPIAWWLTGNIEPLLAARALPLQVQLTPSPGVIALAGATTIFTGLLIVSRPRMGGPRRDRHANRVGLGARHWRGLVRGDADQLVCE
jgi:ABC-type antimicrobial peptide transport system permease subunit